MRVQMAPVATLHIGNHTVWATRRNDFICRHLLARPPPLRRGAAAGAVRVRGALLETRQVQPRHGPLLIENVALDMAAHVPSFSRTAIV